MTTDAVGGSSSSSNTASCDPARANESVEDRARQISLAENGEAKLEATIDEMSCLPPEQAQELLDGVLKQGGVDAFSAVHLESLAADGVVDSAQVRDFSDNVAAMYNDGRLDASDMGQFFSATPASIAPSLGYAYSNPQAALDGATRFFEASSSMEFKRFSDKIAVDVMAGVATSFRPEMAEDFATTVIAAQAATGRSDSFLNAYANTSELGREQIRTNLAEAGREFFQLNNSAVPADGLSILMNAVGKKPGDGERVYFGGTAAFTSGPTRWDGLAVEFARFAAGNPEQFTERPIFGSTTPIDSRAEALGAVFVGHDKAVLDAYTDGFQQSSTDLSARTDRFVLGNLMSLTAHNPDSSYAPQASASIESYADGLFNAVNGDDPAAVNAVDRLQILTPAKLMSAGISGLDTLAGKKAVADFVGDTAKLALGAGGAALKLPASMAEIAGAATIWSKAKSQGVDIGASTLRDWVFDKLAGGEPEALEAALNASAEMLAGAFETRVDQPPLSRALRNTVVGSLEEMFEAIRSEDFSGFRNTLKYE
jgi:hypothetical protein